MTQLARAPRQVPVRPVLLAAVTECRSVGRCAGACVRACVRDRTACRGVSSVGDWGGSSQAAL